VQRVRLDRLELPPPVRDALERLQVQTVGDLVRLPADGLRERFGEEAYRLHQLAAGAVWDPLQPEAPPERAERKVLLDDPEGDVDRLLFGLKHELDALLIALDARKQAIASLEVELVLDRVPAPRRDVLRPAEPTLDARLLLRLLALRLQSHPPEAGVIEVRLSASEVPATRQQLRLAAQKPRRDLAAAEEAFARIRAELGDDAVVKATLRDGHLPEARYAWAPITRLSAPTPSAPSARPLVRRVYDRPVLLPPAVRTLHDDGWLLVGPVGGSVVRVLGPYIVSGAWWAGTSEVHREYSFIETQRGECFWVYFDRQRRRWFLHGKVE
jgi:protein ImuB